MDSPPKWFQAVGTWFLIVQFSHIYFFYTHRHGSEDESKGRGFRQKRDFPADSWRVSPNLGDCYRPLTVWSTWRYKGATLTKPSNPRWPVVVCLCVATSSQLSYIKEKGFDFLVFPPNNPHSPAPKKNSCFFRQISVNNSEPNKNSLHYSFIFFKSFFF